MEAGEDGRMWLTEEFRWSTAATERAATARAADAAGVEAAIRGGVR